MTTECAAFLRNNGYISPSCKEVCKYPNNIITPNCTNLVKDYCFRPQKLRTDTWCQEMIYNKDSWGRYDVEMAGGDGFGGACNNADGDLEVCACSNLLRIKSLIPLFLPKDYKLSNNSIEEMIIVNKLECLYKNCTTSNKVYKQTKMLDGNYCPNTMCVQINDIDIAESKIGSLVNKQECGLGVKLTNDPSTNNVTVQPTTPGLTLDEVKALLEQQKKENDAKIQQLLEQQRQQQQQEQTTVQPITNNDNQQKLFQYAMIGIIGIVIILIVIFLLK